MITSIDTLFFNWRKITLQCYAGFCHITMQISHNYTYIFSFLSLPSPSYPIPHLKVIIEHEAGLPVLHSNFPLAIYFTRCCSVTKLCPALCDPVDCSMLASLPFTFSWSLLKLMSIELVIPSNLLILCHPLLLPSIFPSIRGFSNESAVRIRWPKYWSFSFSISPSNEYSGLISFRMDWVDLLAV